MSVFAMSDLHLSTDSATNKSMEVFGARWMDYENKIKTNWNKIVKKNDTVILPGDISWAISLDGALSDLRFLNSLNGRKIIGKGNHDFWWSTLSKINKFFAENKLDTIQILHNNSFIAENKIIAGTRGWFYDSESNKLPENTDYRKIILREGGRLLASINEAKRLLNENPGSEILVFLHFPPIWNGEEVTEITDILKSNDIKKCYFGHIHGQYSIPASFEKEGIVYSLISSDYLDFLPKIL